MVIIEIKYILLKPKAGSSAVKKKKTFKTFCKLNLNSCENLDKNKF